jgi:2-polyprenyl-6-methoxyphenol hydroxylase-like FAD-dependent oxidoreductase
MADQTVDVLVVGAGPTGLTLAAQLAAHGVRPRLVDRGLDWVHESRALGIQPRTLEVLAGLGITDALIEYGNRGVRLRLHARGREVTLPLFDLGLADTAYPYLLFLSQTETERILGDHLARQQVAVERGVELVVLEPGSDEVVAELRHDGGRMERVSARYVVGCDGAHSTVRTLAGIGFEGGSYPQTFVLADLEAAGIAPDAAHVFVTEHGQLFFFPLGSPTTWRLLAMRPSDVAPPGSQVSLGEVQALADAYTDGAVVVRDPVWMTNFRIHHRAATHYRTRRVFLAGDAAHIHSPAGAQGMNTGIQDAVNLGWKLAYTVRGQTDPTVLDTYEPERAPVGRMVLRFTDRAFTIATSTNRVVRFARVRVVPVVFPLALKARRARGIAFRTLAQLSIRYRSSPLSVDGPQAPRRGPKAGDRVPDASIISDGQASSLHAAIATPGWHLLLCGSTPEWWAELPWARYAGPVAVHRIIPAENREAGRPLDAQVLRDPTGTAMRRLGVANRAHAVYLVRPDGHVGYRSGSIDRDGLTAYLRRWVLRGP